jgi:hypothetical protein
MESLEAHADQGQGVVARVAEAQMEHGMRLADRQTRLVVPEDRQPGVPAVEARAGHALANHETKQGEQAGQPGQEPSAVVSAVEARACQGLTVLVDSLAIEALAAPARFQWRAGVASVRSFSHRERNPEKRQVHCLRLPHNWCRSAGLRRARPRNGRKHGYASPTYYFAFLGLLIASLSKRCEARLFEYGSLSEHKENLMNNYIYNVPASNLGNLQSLG